MIDQEQHRPSWLDGYTLASEVDLSARPSGFLVGNLVVRAGITELVGKPKNGKTQVAVATAVAVATGRDFGDNPAFPVTPHHEGIPHRVSWLSCDETTERVRERLTPYNLTPDELARIKIWDLPARRALQFGTQPPQQARINWRVWAEELLASGTSLLVVDHLMGVVDGVGINDTKDVGHVLSAIKEVTDLGVPVLLLHHAGKGKGSGATSMGSTLIDAVWRAQLAVSKADRRLWFHSNDHPSTETQLSALDGSPLRASEPREVGTTSGASSSATGTVGKPKRNRGPSSIDVANALLSGPEAARRNPTTAGRFLVDQGLVKESADGGRSHVNRAISKEFLARDGVRGPLVAGPKLGGQQQAA